MSEKSKLIFILILISILILIAICLFVFINNSDKTNNESNALGNTELTENINTNYTTTSNEVDAQNRDKKVASLNEKQRMQTYFGRYLSYIESGNYEEAYNLLYDGFKQNYFPTLEDFESYAQNNYPSNMVVEYTNIERQGTIFILTVKIRNALSDNTQTDVKEQQIVVTENNVNDFKLSFEVNSLYIETYGL